MFFKENLRLILFLLLLMRLNNFATESQVNPNSQCNITLSTKHFLHYPSLETFKSIVVQYLEPSRKKQSGCINQTYVALTLLLPIFN